MKKLSLIKKFLDIGISVFLIISLCFSSFATEEIRNEEAAMPEYQNSDFNKPYCQNNNVDDVNSMINVNKIQNDSEPNNNFNNQESTINAQDEQKNLLEILYNHPKECVLTVFSAALLFYKLSSFFWDSGSNTKNIENKQNFENDYNITQFIKNNLYNLKKILLNHPKKSALAIFIGAIIYRFTSLAKKENSKSQQVKTFDLN